MLDFFPNFAISRVKLICLNAFTCLNALSRIRSDTETIWSERVEATLGMVATMFFTNFCRVKK